MMTSQKSDGKNLKDQIYSQEDSPAKTSARQEKAKELSKGKGQAFGNIIKKRLGYYDQKSHSLKTYQCCLAEDSMLSLQILPKWGMMRNGLVFQLKRLGQ